MKKSIIFAFVAAMPLFAQEAPQQPAPMAAPQQPVAAAPAPQNAMMSAQVRPEMPQFDNQRPMHPHFGMKHEGRFPMAPKCGDKCRCAK